MTLSDTTTGTRAVISVKHMYCAVAAIIVHHDIWVNWWPLHSQLRDYLPQVQYFIERRVTEAHRRRVSAARCVTVWQVCGLTSPWALPKPQLLNVMDSRDHSTVYHSSSSLYNYPNELYCGRCSKVGCRDAGKRRVTADVDLDGKRKQLFVATCRL